MGQPDGPRLGRYIAQCPPRQRPAPAPLRGPHRPRQPARGARLHRGRRRRGPRWQRRVRRRPRRARDARKTRLWPRRWPAPRAHAEHRPAPRAPAERPKPHGDAAACCRRSRRSHCRRRGGGCRGRRRRVVADAARPRPAGRRRRDDAAAAVRRVAAGPPVPRRQSRRGRHGRQLGQAHFRRGRRGLVVSLVRVGAALRTVLRAAAAAFGGPRQALEQRHRFIRGYRAPPPTRAPHEETTLKRLCTRLSGNGLPSGPEQRLRLGQSNLQRLLLRPRRVPRRQHKTLLTSRREP
mmetsp:Transcript_30754/g.108176  ORF Transcript_30754/g.108176 Transcript_30754/m.108176 type:complete len:293 (+) Transcript_30754:699-1577(+)